MNQQQIQTLVKSTEYLKLLYVEDDPLTRKSMLETFNIFFKDITIATDGEEGFNTFNKGEFDIIITDINMPKINGIDMIYRIREINKEITILIVSAHDDSSYFKKTIEAGVDGYLLKPINLTQFITLLEKSVVNMNTQTEVEKKLCRDSLTGKLFFGVGEDCNRDESKNKLLNDDES